MSPTNLPEWWPLVGRDAELRAAIDGLMLPAVSGVVLYGPPSSGKSRLGRALLQRMRGRGVPVAGVTATVASQEVPMGAVAPLLSPGAGNGANARSSAVATSVPLNPALRRRRGRPAAVVLVDDLQFLDDASRKVLLSLMRVGELKVVGTVSGQDAKAPAAAWLQDGVCSVRAVHVPPLDEPTVTALLERVLDGVVEERSSRLLHTLSSGLPLHLVELVSQAVATGALNQDGGIWRVAQDLSPSDRLTAMVTHRFNSLTERERDVLDDLALAGPETRQNLDPDVVGSLTRKGLVHTQRDGNGGTVALADPVHGLVIRATTSAFRARRLLLNRAERAERDRANPPLTAVLWRLQASDPVPVERLERSISQARAASDFAAAHTLARALIQRRPDGVSHLLAGEFGFECGEHVQAEEVLRKLMTLETSDEIRLRGVVLRTQNLALGMLRVDDALAVNSEARDEFGTGWPVDVLDANEAALWGTAGHVGHAHRLMESLDSRGANELADIVAAAPRVYVESERGHPPDPEPAGLQQPPDKDLLIEGEYGIPEIVLDSTRARSFAEAGEFATAMTLARRAYEQAVSSRAHTAQFWPAMHLGWICYLRGDLSGARFWFATLVALSREHSFLLGLWSGLQGQALVAAVTGELSEAKKALEDAESLPPHRSWRPEARLVRAWVLAAEGKLSQARGELFEGAREAREFGLEVTRTHCLFDAIRLGGVDQAHEELVATLKDSDNPFVQLRLRAATARARNDATSLEKCAEELARTGAFLLAAEVANWTAMIFAGQGETRSAARMSARVQEYCQDCGPVRTPGLAPPRVLALLTTRELEIALLAAGGRKNVEIAEELGISVRTAGNHLQRVYVKFGISDRRNLRAALDMAPGDQPYDAAG
ncbi:LuxR C-terminal-related transcriptional regulator [Streptomyces sp. NPDC047108]|uniref:helix-turn-helix transcriptional regulator n=1 Tax=Streptomyces sp. NPDC047108 TaxID=3155025 RepID=UPI0033F01D1E